MIENVGRDERALVLRDEQRAILDIADILGLDSPYAAHEAFGSPMERPRVPAGVSVEVRTRYMRGQWAQGYEVAEVLPTGYRILRRGSQEVLPDVFSIADVRSYGDS